MGNSPTAPVGGACKLGGGEEDRHRCEESRYLRFEIFLQ